MRILLTTSAAPVFSPFSTKEKRFPLGIGFLISVLKEKGHRVYFLDNYLAPTHFYETDFVIKNRIEAVGIYSSTICFDDTLRMIKALHKLRKLGKWNGLIIVGGPHTSVSVESIPDEVDFIVQGEGERALLEIIEGRVKERIVRAERIKDLDELPLPAWDYFVKLPYDYSVEWFKETPVFTMNTSRGCPFGCRFCSVGSIWGKKYTYMSAERIVDDIKYLIKKYGVKGIYFREDNFTLNKERIKNFCEILLNKNIKIKWICETRVDTLDKELLELMYKAGCRGLYLGVESGSQRVLNFLKKGITIHKTREVISLCKQIGIPTAASFIVGIPTETSEEIKETLKFARKLKTDIKWVNVFVGIPDSELYKYVIQNKLYEYKDKKGFVYPKGSSKLAKKIYGKGFVYIDKNTTLQENKREVIKDCQIADPKISVIMPVYNASEFVMKAVESILSQDFEDFELIIIDDGSTDKTSDLLSTIKDARVKIIKQEHTGLTSALNVAIKESRGKYIARMDADDISEKMRLTKQYEFLNKYNNYGLVGTSFIVIDENDKEIGRFPIFNEDSKLRKMLLIDNQFCHGSLMFRKEVVEVVGLYDTDFQYAQDYEYIWRISKKFKIGGISEFLYKWRKGSKSISFAKKDEQYIYAEALKERIRNEFLNEYIYKSTFNFSEESPDTHQAIKEYSLRLRYRYALNCAKLGWYYLKKGADTIAEELFRESITHAFFQIHFIDILSKPLISRGIHLSKQIKRIKKMLS